MFAKSGLHASLIADFTLCASEIGGDKKEVPILVSFFFFANSANPKSPHQYQLSALCAEQLLGIFLESNSKTCLVFFSKSLKMPPSYLL